MLFPFAAYILWHPNLGINEQSSWISTTTATRHFLNLSDFASKIESIFLYYLYSPMEFFRTANTQTTETEIKERISIDSISDIYPDIIVLESNNNEFKMGSIWGEFSIRRDNIKR
jgi:hypothetical protein